MDLMVASVISMTICFYINFYLAKKAHTPWIRKAASGMMALCLVNGLFAMAILAWR